MHQICILGGYGNTGCLIAQYLLETTEVGVTIAGRNLQRAESLAQQFQKAYPGRTIQAAAIDASDPQSLMSGFRGIDLVVVASSTSQFTSLVTRIAIDSQTDYLDIQYSRQKLNVLKSMREEIQRAGRCFITDGGFHPGLPGVLVRYANTHFSQLDRAVVGSVIQINWSEIELSDSTAEELVRELIDFRPLVYRDGEWHRSSWMKSRQFDFGARFGVQSAFPMLLEELRELQTRIPALQETGFYVGGFNWFVDYFLLPILWPAVKLAPVKLIRPSARIMLWGLRTFSRPPFGTSLHLEASGKMEGKKVKMTLVLDHEDGYMFTAIPVAACLHQYIDGTIREPGLHYQALFVEPDRMIQTMQEMGIHISELTEPAEE